MQVLSSLLVIFYGDNSIIVILATFLGVQKKKLEAGLLLFLNLLSILWFISSYGLLAWGNNHFGTSRVFDRLNKDFVNE